MKYPPQDAEPKLFNLNSDPDEKDNLASQNPALVKELSLLLDEWYVPGERTTGKFAQAEPAPPENTRKKRKRK
jgi:hypothetical protein